MKGKLKCGTEEVYWTMITEIASPFVSALSKAHEAMHEKIKSEVLELVNQKYPDGNVIIDGNFLVIYGEK